MDRQEETAFLDQNAIALAIGMRDLEIMALRARITELEKQLQVASKKA